MEDSKILPYFIQIFMAQAYLISILYDYTPKITTAFVYRIIYLLEYRQVVYKYLMD